MLISNEIEKERSAIEMLFHGTKEFWHDRCELDIHIALHTSFSCVELVIYEACMGIDYPRVYLDYTGLKSKINVLEYNALLDKKRENRLKHPQKSVPGVLEAEASNELLLSLLLDGVEAKSKPGCVGLFNVFVFGRVLGMGSIPFSRDMPQELEPLHIRRHLHNTVEDVHGIMHNVRSDQRRQLINNNFLSAVSISAISTAAHRFPSIAEKDALFTAPIRRWRSAIRKVINALATHRAEQRIMQTSLCDWYTALKEKVMRQEGTRAHVKKMKRKIHVLALLSKSLPPSHNDAVRQQCGIAATAASLYEDFNGEATTSFGEHLELPDLRRSHRQRRSMHEYRQPRHHHSRNLSQHDNSSASTSSSTNSSPSQSSRIKSISPLILLPPCSTIESNSASSPKTSRNYSTASPKLLDSPSSPSVRRMTITGTLSPRRVAHDDPYFKKENQQVRSLSPVGRDVKKFEVFISPALDRTATTSGSSSVSSSCSGSPAHKAARAGSSSRSRSGSCSLPALPPQHSPRLQQQQHVTSVAGNEHTTAGTTVATTTSTTTTTASRPSLMNSFANHMTKLEQNVAISKFGSAHRKTTEL